MATEREALLEAIRAGDEELSAALVEKMDVAARSGCVPAVTQILRGLRPENEWSVFYAGRLAGLACQSTPAGAAKWVLWINRLRRQEFPASSAEILAGHGPEWLGELAHRLAAELDKERRQFEGTPLHYHLVQNLIGLSGCATPTNFGYAIQRLRFGGLTNPDAPILVPIALEVEGFGAWMGYLGPGLVDMTESGKLDRTALIDQCVGRLFRGGRPHELRGFRRLLDDLTLTDDELADRAGDWARLAADADAPTAGDAVRRLRRLIDAGRLDVGLLGDASRDVLARPEKGLVSAQLKHLGQALRSSTDGAGQLLTAATVAFGHEDNAVQEQAWKLVARHIAKADPAARAQIVEAVAVLTPDLREQATAALGESTPGSERARTPYQETLPPVVAPQRASAPPETLPELIGEIVAIVAAPHASTVESERALDGLVRFAHRDRAALAAALRSVPAKQWPWQSEGQVISQRFPDRQPYPVAGIGVIVLALLLGGLDAESLPVVPPEMSDNGTGFPPQCGHCVFRAAWRARIFEVARAVLADPPPFLLSGPSWRTGVVDTDVLLDRLAEYARLGITAGSADFDQALLRVRIPVGPDRDRLAGAAAALGTAEGTRFAQWLSSGGLTVVEESTGLALPALREGFTDPFRRLDVLLRKHHNAGPVSQDLPDSSLYHLAARPLDLPQWVATLPLVREYIAAQMISTRAGESDFTYVSDLPLLAAADGPIGPLFHRLLANTLSRGRPDGDMDALLQLVARNEMDAKHVGECLIPRNKRGGRQPAPDLLDLLTEIARIGAHTTAWNILAGALPGLLSANELPRRLGALLSLAADCASTSGATGSIPELEAIADRTGSSQTIKQARRLRQILTEATR
ncbi:DUF6493 family protein [Micromonospora sp. MSM11]|nr:DUF6493 family protein [Micromonospora sp. MSM11]MCL7456422.1 DUF6493 family protein [Micromonospora sp. MSM11]